MQRRVRSLRSVLRPRVLLHLLPLDAVPCNHRSLAPRLVLLVEARPLRVHLVLQVGQVRLQRLWPEVLPA